MNKPLSEQMQKLMDRRERATGKGLETRARTNGDRFRSMPADEMAKFLSKFVQERTTDSTYMQTWLDWLQLPYKEEE